MNMTYEQVLRFILTFLQINHLGYVAAANQQFQKYKRALGYRAGVNCNRRGWDVFKETKRMDNNRIILRYKDGPGLRAPVFFVLPEAEEQFHQNYPNARRDN